MIRNTVIAFIVLLMFSFLNIPTVTFAAADCTNSIYAKANYTFCDNQRKEFEAQYASLVKQLASQNKTSSNYASEVKKLTTQIEALKLKIKARNLAIVQLKNDINKKVSTISSLSEKIESEYESLGQLIRNINEFDSQDMLHLVLSDKNISDFYSDLESYDSIKKAVKDSVEKITGIKTDTEVQKKDLETKQSAELDAKYELETAQKKVALTEADKKKLLSDSKNKESSYQLLAAQKKAQADKIRAALFQLRDSAAIPFGTALEYANLAKKFTGVSSAFLLAIIQQESNFGIDTGGCYVTNFETGAGVSSKSGKAFPNVMKPTRDVLPFKIITAGVGRDPNKTLVSCPIGGYGYGGAMGPAQFIPSTWIGIKDKVGRFLGIKNPDPWNARDALMASSTFLAELGANTTYSSQIKAACSYYGTRGTTCAYGTQVMNRVAKIQENIDLITGN